MQMNTVNLNPMKPKWPLMVNLALFQAGWFACLLLPLVYALLVAVVILLIHFAMLVPRMDWRSEAVLLMKAVAVGAVLEVAYLLFGILVKVEGGILPPLWLLIIWVLFATTFRHGLFWLRDRRLMSALFAALAAPGSYFGGATLNESMDLGEPIIISLLVVAVSWAIVFPLLMAMVEPLKSEPVR